MHFDVPEPVRPNAMEDQDLEKGKGCRGEGPTSAWASRDDWPKGHERTNDGAPVMKGQSSSWQNDQLGQAVGGPRRESDERKRAVGWHADSIGSSDASGWGSIASASDNSGESDLAVVSQRQSEQSSESCAGASFPEGCPDSEC